MKDESYKNIFEIKDTQESILNWIKKLYISQRLQQQLSHVNILITPTENVHGHEGPVFPLGTEELFLFLKENASDELIPEICIEDKDYVELMEHWDLFTVGSLIVTCIVAPLVVNLIYDYVKNRVGLRLFETQVKLDLTIGRDGNSTNMHYEGPAEELRETLLPAINDLSKK